MTYKSNKKELLDICNNSISYEELLKLANACPKCGSLPSDHEVKNHSMMWHEGDIHCVKCNTFVRTFDAG